ncbi:MAG: hypothetical protein H0W64_11070 [Gammaproteobacteria bacterium]|nr:hypothetical protein [Gammaproteobacteria bacterium]
MFSKNNLRFLTPTTVIDFQSNKKNMTPKDIIDIYGAIPITNLTPADLQSYSSNHFIISDREYNNDQNSEVLNYEEIKLKDHTDQINGDMCSELRDYTFPATSKLTYSIPSIHFKNSEGEGDKDSKIIKLFPNYNSHWGKFNDTNMKSNLSYTDMFFEQFGLEIYRNKLNSFLQIKIHNLLINKQLAHTETL